jgi:hypothetical protein
MGSPAVAALIAHVTFWLMLAYGWFWDELGPVSVGIFVVLWLSGYFGLPYLPNGAAMFSSCVAVLDVVLVLMVFKEDLKLK